MKRVDTVIVGGGPAGAAAAYGLAGEGRDVVLIERSKAPHHKVCGEFISVETQAYLARLGIDAAALGATAIESVTLSTQHCSVTGPLPFRALSLSRYRLDEALLQRAAESGADVRRGFAVRAVVRDRDRWIVRCDSGTPFYCRNLVLATGKWGVRGVEDERDRSQVGLKMHFRPKPRLHAALRGRVELSLLESGYAGLELVEDGIANLALLLPRAAVAELALGWRPLRDYIAGAMPALAERLDGSEPLWEKPLAVVCPSGGHLHARVGATAFRIGDRLAHIPPFTGDGLAIALASAALAVEHIAQGHAPDVYLAAAQKLIARPIRNAGALLSVAASRAGRAALICAAGFAPRLIGAMARRTRLPVLPASPPPGTGSAARLAIAQSRR